VPAAQAQFLPRLTEFDRLSLKLKAAGAVLEKEGLEERRGGFVDLQKQFLSKYGPIFCKEVTSCFHKMVHVRSAPVSELVKQRFLDARSTLSGGLSAGYHGTNVANLASIYQNGLLIPGHGNNISVANGSVHGLGIYTAKICNPQLSWGFCRASSEAEKKIMVCGVLDDAPYSTGFQSYSMGIRTVSKESQNVRHVGEAMVVFDDRRVAPLFEISLGSALDVPQQKLTIAFDWSRWTRKVNQLLQSTPPVKERRPRNYRLLQHQMKQRTVVAYLGRRGARKRNLKGM